MAIVADTFVTDLAKYLHTQTSIPVFKYEDRPTSYNAKRPDRWLYGDSDAIALGSGSNITMASQHDDLADFSGEYIAVNNLPFVYGRVVNDVNVLNVNIHVPELEYERRPATRLNQLIDTVLTHIPLQRDTEDFEPLAINNHYYAVRNISQPMKDNDKTYFVNMQVSVTFSNI